MFEKRVTPGKSYCVTAYSPVVITASLNNKNVTLVDATDAGQYFFVAPTTTVVSSISPNYIIEVKGSGAGDSGNSGSGSGVGISFEKAADFDSLPETGKLGTIYLVPTEDADNQWTEYVYIDGRYEIIGSKDFTGPDLENYAKLNADNIFTGNTNTFNGTVVIGGDGDITPVVGGGETIELFNGSILVPSHNTLYEYTGAENNIITVKRNTAVTDKVIICRFSSNKKVTVTGVEWRNGVVPTFANGTSVSIEIAQYPDKIEAFIAGTVSDFISHILTDSIHLTEEEHRGLKNLIARFPDITPDYPEVSIPDEALSYDVIRNYFAVNAEPGTTVAPGCVYVSRVPLAYYIETVNEATGETVLTPTHTQSAIIAEDGDVAAKFMDNAPNGVPLKHIVAGSADTPVDEYAGKWPFFWARGNFIEDKYGAKHLINIEGASGGTSEFTNNKNVGTFGPAFWFFCVDEKRKNASGQYENFVTDPDNVNNMPEYQLWGILDKPFKDLDASRKAELLSHGVTEEDVHIWPECLFWDGNAINDDGTSGKWIERPYWIHSAYCGGCERDAVSGIYTIVSKRNTPLYNNMSWDKLTGLSNIMKNNGGGNIAVQGFGILFDIIKNATKNSQSINAGNSNRPQTATLLKYSTSTPDYIIPLDGTYTASRTGSLGNFRIGQTVYLSQKNIYYENTTAEASYPSESIQIGRIQNIEQRTFTDITGTSYTKYCLIIDPETVEPFVVRTSVADTDAEIAQGRRACCYIACALSMAGETDLISSKIDGSYINNTDGFHPYRTMGTEYMPGAWILAVDVYSVPGDNKTYMVDGKEIILPSTERVIFQMKNNGNPRSPKSNCATSITAGYNIIGIIPGKTGYILNAKLDSVSGMVYPTMIGGSSSTGHGDNLESNTTVSANGVLSGGICNLGAAAGSAFLSALFNLGYAYWYYASRL